ncbi:MAG TPA: SDR family NAD(P)-dependent oxidoreductase [Pyrinomonadaceae bacterium]|nr:SDR family NAD(P)-dependent oxidoreductase [Pyrinomonadaceae bacterium]
MKITDQQEPAESIAIVGLACRFPGANNIDQFWQNLRNGVESISFFSDEEVEHAGVNPADLKNPNYVKAGGILEDIENFDAQFFGFTPKEAEMMDPQHRFFLECCWEALEHAGYHPDKYAGLIGLYGGAGANTYLLYNLSAAGYLRDSDLLPAAFIYNKNDHLTGRVAYKLNLRGPSVTVQTACSTSLVAVSMACQSLLNYEVDTALAGGATIMASQKIGYMYTEGGINSPDGHCRAFDAKANGTVMGNGAGVVVLKRLKDALADGDNIWAVILGSATNNDGSLKAGYTAPSVDSQTEVIALAQGLAGVSPETITYVETHGTGTALGDPIEIEALTKAFRARTNENNFCAIGSVKTGIGHLDTAAGVAGLIKTALMLHHRQIPPSLHFETPNPHLELDRSPFFVNTRLRPWNPGATPLRAGVSSFGLSGTNAHVVLEEAPASEASGPSRSSQLLLISAKTAHALDATCANLVDFLKQNPSVNLADVAHTLKIGRKAFPHRRMVVCKNSDEAITALQALTPDRLSTSVQESANRPLTFMFPGQGSQFVNMGVDLYRSEPAFREHVDYCSLYLKEVLGVDLRSLLFPDESDREEAAKKLDQTSFTQPALFVIEYALARLLMEFGVQPTALIGHSIGEYTAACLAGVFSLDDALRLVAERGRLIQSLPGGSMLAVQMAESQLRNMVGEKLALAAVNGVGQCVVSGANEAIDQFEQELSSKGIACQRLRTSHAFHSELIEPALQPLLQFVKGIELNPPEIPFISNVTGTWITNEDATDPDYWVEHMRQTVRFADGVKELLKDPEAILLEVGPGLTLKTLTRWHPDKKPAQLVISSIPSPRERQEEVPYLLKAVGQLWLAGVEPDWTAFTANESRRRVPLPTYPFDRQRHWIDLDLQSNENQLGPRSKPYNKRLEMENWFSVPAWKETPRLSVNGNQKTSDKTILVFADHFDLTRSFLELAKEKYQHVIWVGRGPAFLKHDDTRIDLNPEIPEDYDALFQELSSRNLQPETIVNFWNVTPDIHAKLDDLTGLGEQGFFTLLYLAQSIGRAGITNPLKLVVVSNGLRQVTGAEELHPEKAIVLGPVQVFPREYPNVTCQSIDITIPPEGSRQEQWLAGQILAELSAPRVEPIVAYRDNRRWLQRYETVALHEARNRQAVLRDGGVYLITGGVGGLGLEVADYLARTCRAKLVLVNRSPFPARDEWSEWLQTHGADNRVSKTIVRIRGMEESGAEVLILSADVADEEAMREVFARTRERFRELNGIVHAAGIPAGGLMQIKKPESVREVFAAKVKGTRVLEKLVEDISLDFFVLFSSLSAIVGRLGQVDYVGANAFLDLFSQYYRAKTGRFTVSIDWSAWEQVGMAAHLFREPLNGKEAKKELPHPLLDRRVVAEDGREIYITDFAPERQWTLDEHRIAGYPVIPGVGFFEMVRAALGERAKGRVIEFRDVFFLAPVHVAIGEKREVRLELEQDDEGFEFTVRSNPNGNGNGDESGLRSYATGRVTIHEPAPPAQYDLASFQQRCNAREIVLTEEDRDEDLGPRWHSVRRVHIGNKEIFIPLEIPENFAGDFEQMKFHPALLDRMTGLTKKYLAGGPYLPFTYKRLRIMGELPRKIYGYGRYKEEESVSREMINFDLKLMDEQGRGLVEVEGFGQKQVRDIAEEIRAISNVKTGASGPASTQLAQESSSREEAGSGSTEDLEIYKGRISPADGVEALDRILAAQLEPQVIVCPQDLQITLEQAAKASGERFLSAIKAQQKTKAVPTRIRQHSAYVPPATDAERKITQIWQDVLGIEEVGIHDSFFELGGSSLFAIQVLSRLRNEFNVEIPPAMIFEGATISALAKLLTKDQDEKPEFKVQQSRGERRKTKAQERLSQKAQTVS